MTRIFGLTREYEPVMPEFDDLDQADVATLERAKKAHDPEPDPYLATYQRLNFGNLE